MKEERGEVIMGRVDIGCTRRMRSSWPERASMIACMAAWGTDGLLLAAWNTGAAMKQGEGEGGGKSEGERSSSPPLAGGLEGF